MKTENEVRRELFLQMKYYQDNPECAYSVHTIETLKEVLEEDDNHFVLPHPNYSQYHKDGLGYYNAALAVAHVSYQDKKKTELAVAVNLYNKKGKWVNTTDGWLISTFSDTHIPKYMKLESRRLFVPKPQIALEWETDGAEFFKNERPMATWKNEDEDQEPEIIIGWTDIETGQPLETNP